MIQFLTMQFPKIRFSKRPFGTCVSLMIVAGVLSGCSSMHRDVSTINDAMYKSSAKTRSKWAGYLFNDNEQPVAPPPSPHRYCYDVRADVVCYDQPKASIVTQRVGTGVLEEDTVIEASPQEEWEVSQVYNVDTSQGQAGVMADPNRNIGQFFNPAKPNASPTQALRFNDVANRPSGAFIPEAPPIRGVGDPVSNTPSKRDTSGFVQASPSKAKKTNASSFNGSGPSTMNTEGPLPTKPLEGFEAPSPLM